MRIRERQLGDICRDWASSWFVIDRIGPEGGTYGPRFLSKRPPRSDEFGSLNTNTNVVPPEEVPEEVSAALAYFRLTGKAVQK